jgi:signal transduction histidine kinase
VRRALTRLRWQLTLSHLVAIACTLVSMIAAVVLIGTTFIASQSASNASRDAAQDARLVAESVSGLVARSELPELNGVLRAIADGSLRVVAPFGPPDRRPPAFFGPGLRNIAYIVVLGTDGQPLASSDPAGAVFDPPERGQWTGLAAQALAGRRPSNDGVQVAGGPGALGAATIFDPADTGQPIGTVIVATGAPAPPASGGSPGFFSALAIFGAASVAVLAAASLFALVSSSLVAYVLASRLVRRLERLGQAVEAFAAGNLSSRAQREGEDEVGQLTARFNRMADELAGTLRELQAERDRVAGLLAARQQLVAGVSHELRTPVATMRGYLEAALRRDGGQASARSAASDDTLRGDLATIERELARLEHLIDDLFTLSSAEVGRLALRLEPTDLASLVHRLVDTHAPLAWSQRRVQVLADLPAEVPLVRADAQRVEQIVSNLLGNAIRHTPPGGLVAATASVDAETVCLEVRDTGDGIDPQDLPHVFERFYRGRGEDGRAGLGLGLALVKELAEAMGGSSSVTSTPGEGSSFAVHLPRA